MLEFDPCRALVRPRVSLPEAGGTVPLESEVASLVDEFDHGAIAIVGGMGSGRTTALQHLAALLSDERPIQLIDCPSLGTLRHLLKTGPVIYAAQRPLENDHLGVFHLAPWGVDEWIEYCQAAHPERCGSIMSRVMKFEHPESLEGKPALWRIVLDALAKDENLTTSDAALEAYIAATYQNEFVEVARGFCFGMLLTPRSFSNLFKEESKKSVNDLLSSLTKSMEKVELKVLRYSAVQMILARDHLLDHLRSPGETHCLVHQHRRELIQRAAVAIKNEPPLIERLLKIVNNRDSKPHPMAASLLHLSMAWRAEVRQVKRYTGGYFHGASWVGAELREAKFRYADLSGADLTHANLDQSILNNANCSRASFVSASLCNARGRETRFTRADFSAANAHDAQFERGNFIGSCFKSAKLNNVNFEQANLCGASFLVADLTQANLEGAKFDGADFTGAILDGVRFSRQCLRVANFNRARFVNAAMAGCDCGFLSLPKANFSAATLSGADFTGSSIPQGDFSKAVLFGAKLAEIDWPHANLQGANLTGATFHMGSTRTGHVNSTIASEGSKTGFYTDEFHEQGFKAPEEIRKANLRGADLRGAVLDNVDFYLVDLRDALYDEEHKLWFQKCGAILESRVK